MTNEEREFCEKIDRECDAAVERMYEWAIEQDRAPCDPNAPMLGLSAYLDEQEKKMKTLKQIWDEHVEKNLLATYPMFRDPGWPVDEYNTLLCVHDNQAFVLPMGHDSAFTRSGASTQATWEPYVIPIKKPTRKVKLHAWLITSKADDALSRLEFHSHAFKPFVDGAFHTWQRVPSEDKEVEIEE